MFQFRFDSLLRLRESERDAARQEVADGHQAMGILQQQREDLEQQRQQLRDTAQRRMSEASISVDTMLNQGRYDVQLAAEIQGIASNMAAVEKEIERRQTRLQAADIEVKRLERLRETQQQQWNADQLAAQQADLDEIATLRFARASRNQGAHRWD
ncbi:flagellar export protein FliJ [Roseimaritima ulvae]|uniref:Flagellar FliJ protein n=1 Tax=Roseimaritima ulvae TaxID=980254 RepID=A0A5B9QZ86_9BACT|nr:flagellar export protein FliJ [Roseimaritima ulvae]QEG42735.1 Flagellar FliJ protein [Roseimaritima ulvae]